MPPPDSVEDLEERRRIIRALDALLAIVAVAINAERIREQEKQAPPRWLRKAS